MYFIEDKVKQKVCQIPFPCLRRYDKYQGWEAQTKQSRACRETEDKRDPGNDIPGEDGERQREEEGERGRNKHHTKVHWAEYVEVKRVQKDEKKDKACLKPCSDFIILSTNRWKEMKPKENKSNQQ